MLISLGLIILKRSILILFKSIDQLRTIFSDVLTQKEIITYCGGGIAATSVALALDMLGHKNVKVYDASLTEWAADETLPMDV